MTTFSVRIELPGASSVDYAALDEAMIEEGFVRWVLGTGDQEERLPVGEYNYTDTESELHQSTVLSRAEEAAFAVRPEPRPSIILTESDSRVGLGLDASRGS
jgi:hypothetical protein